MVVVVGYYLAEWIFEFYVVVPMRGGDIVVVYVVCKNGTFTGFVIVLLEFQYYTKNLYLHGAIPGGVAGGLGTVTLVYCKTSSDEPEAHLFNIVFLGYSKIVLPGFSRIYRRMIV